MSPNPDRAMPPSLTLVAQSNETLHLRFSVETPHSLSNAQKTFLFSHQRFLMSTSLISISGSFQTLLSGAVLRWKRPCVSGQTCSIMCSETRGSSFHPELGVYFLFFFNFFIFTSSSVTQQILLLGSLLWTKVLRASMGSRALAS